MKRRYCIVMLMAFSFIGSGCGSNSSPDFKVIDRYLTTWDQFAQGNNALASRIRDDRDVFERHLSDALKKNDKRAPGRVVFYAVVQVGGFIPIASPIGQAFKERFGDAVTIYTNEKDGSKSYFAGNLYFWWEAHKSEFAPCPLYDEWHQRDFAKRVVIPMYEGAAKDRK